jgi:hypothetical protein
MAALDDEEEEDQFIATGGAGAGQQYGQVSPSSPSALGAGDIDEEGPSPGDYGGGADQPAQTGSFAKLLLANRAFQKMPPEAQARLLELDRQRSSAAAVNPQVLFNNPNAAQMFGGEPLQLAGEPPAPPKQDEGFMAIVGRALLRAGEDAAQTTALAQGKTPEASKVPAADFETGLGLEDLVHPVNFVKKLGFELVRGGVFQIPAMIAGGAAGTAVGGPVGGAAGAAMAIGAVAGAQALGPAYVNELQKTPDDPDGSFDRALAEAKKAGLVSAASMALFGYPVFKNAVKSLFVKAVETAPDATKEVLKIPLKEQVAVQAVGQPAISVAGEAGYNYAEGKPLTENLGQAAVSAIPNVIMDAAGRFAANRVARSRERAPAGVDADQAAALEQYGPPMEQYGPPMEQYGPPMPPPPVQGPPMPPGMVPGPGGMPLRPEPVPPGRTYPEPPPYEAPPPPPGTGPGGTPLGPEPVPPRPPGGPGGAPLGPEPTPAPGPTQGPPNIGPGGRPLGPEPTPAGQPPPEGPTPPTPPPEPLTPPPEPPPAPGRSRIQERYGAAGPEPTPEAAAAAGPSPQSRLQERYGVEGEAPGTGFTTRDVGGEEVSGPGKIKIEPDHLDQTRSVAKNELGEVIGKGATPREAVADVIARKGEPYAEQAPPGEAAAAKAAREKGIQVGDEVQWTSGGQDQFQAPRKVTRFLDDTHVQVEGSSTGIPIGELTKTRAAGGAEKAPGAEMIQKPQTRAEQLKSDIETLDARKAADKEYRDLLSTGSKSKAKGQTWRDKAVSLATSLSTADEVKAKAEAAKEKKQAKAAEVKEKVKPAEGTPSQITNDMKRQLALRAYLPDEIRNMTPKQAHDILAKPPDAGEIATRVEQREASKTPARGTEKSAPVSETVTTRRKSSFPQGTREQALAEYDKVLKDWIDGKATKAQLDEASAVYRQKIADIEGTRTKTGGFTMGEGAEVTRATKAETSTSTPVSRGARAEAEALSRVTTKYPEVPEILLPEGGYDRVGQYLVEKMLEKGGLSPRKAYEHYGEQKSVGEPGRGPGAPRTQPNLAEFVKEAIRAAEDPNIEANLRARLQQADERLKTLTGAARKKAAIEERLGIEQQLKHEERVKQHLSDLKAIRDELDAIARGETTHESMRFIDRLRERRAEVDRRIIDERVRSPEVNAPILKLLDSSPSTKLGDYLDLIADNPRIRAVSPLHAALARVLRSMLPRDIEVRHNRTMDSSGRHLGFESGRGRIEINPDLIRDDPAYAPVSAILHEALHAATVKYIDHIFGTPEGSLLPSELAHKRALRAIADEITRVLNDPNLEIPYSRRFGDYTNTMTIPERAHLAYAASEASGTATSGSLHEVITQALASPEVQGVLARSKASSEFKAALSNAGMSGRGLSTVWDGFKRVMRAMFGLGSESDTVLDNIMRPLGEITEHGAHYRAEFIKAYDEGVRANSRVIDSTPSARNSLSREDLRRAGTTLAGNVRSRLAQIGMRTSLGGATLDAIHDFIKPVLPSVSDHRAARERVAEASRNEIKRDITTTGANGERITEANIDKTTRLYDALTKGPDADKLGKLMTDATLAEAHLDPRDPNVGNTHLTTDIERNTLAELQSRFSALDPRAQQAYRELRDVYKNWYERERTAGLRSVIDYALPDLDVATRGEIFRKLQTREGVMGVLTDPAAEGLAARLGGKWENKKDLIHRIAELQRAGFTRGDYFPLRRYGEYVISYGKPHTPNYGVEMFETHMAASNRRSELMDKGRTDVSQVFNKATIHRKSLFAAPEQALNPLESAMAKAGLSEDAQHAVRDLYVGQLIQSGTRMATNTMRREGIAGASVNQARNLLNDFMAYTARIGHLEHGGEVINSLNRMDKEATALRQPGSGASANRVMMADQTVEELRKRLAPVDGDSSSDMLGRTARALTTTSFMANLMRPAQLVMQLADTHATASSLMGARHGLGAAPLALTRAMAELSGVATKAAGRNIMRVWSNELHSANWDLSEVYRKRLEKVMDPNHANLLIDRLNQSGLIDYTKTRELRRMAGPQGWASGIKVPGANFVSKFLDVWSAGEHAADSMSRAAVAKAAFQLELSKTKSVDMALDYAVQMARDTQPNYNSYNKSRLATGLGPLGRLGAPLITQFKQFGLHMYGVQGNLIAKAARSTSAAERREAYAALGYLQGSHALLSGVNAAVFGSVPVMAGLGLYDLIFGGAGKPYTNQQLDTTVRNWAYDTLGKTGSELFARGLPAALGIDAHYSVQFSNLLGIPELKSFDAKGFTDFAYKTMTGAAGETSASMLQAAYQMLNGNFQNASRLMPRTPRDFYDAYMWANYGVKDAKGIKTIVPPENLSAYDIGLKMAGFNPTAVTTPRDARAGIQLDEDVSKAIKGTIMDRYMRLDPKDRTTEEITRYNKDHPEDPIRGVDIQRRVREQAMANAIPALYGVRVSKSQMGRAQQLGRFAGG